MIQTLGLPAGPVARPQVVMASEATSARVRPDMTEYGATGTPIFGGGFLRDLGEYNSEFQGGPFSAFRTYEKMRRGDAQVSSTLAASKLPIRCAEWAVLPPKDASPIEKEAAEFVEKCLFDELDFNGVIENALLMFEFGVAAHEDVWEAVNGRLQWKKLAARLPLTFYEWATEGNSEDLAALIQMGYKGSQFVRTAIPAGKLTVFTFRQEGSNFAGRALLREMYQHWFIKSKLYAIDSITCERNGMGVPTVVMGPDAKKEDIALAKEWTSTLSAGEATGLVLPTGWAFELKGVTGTTRDPQESIIHHNNMISMAGLAMFMQLGQTKSGNRALGDSMSDFFYMGLQSTADQVGARISKTSIARLVAMNFGGNVRPPRLVPQRILALKFEAITTALGLMGRGGLMTPTPALEAWLREQIGAPEADEATITRIRAKTTTSGRGAAPAAGAGQQPGAQPGAPGGAADATGGTAKEETAGQEVPIEPVAASDVAATGLKLRREPRGMEKHLALHDIVTALDKGRVDVAAAIRAARPRIQAEVIHKLVDSPVRNMHRVSVAPDERLTGEIEGILRGVSDFGQAQVGKERESQLAGRAPGGAATIRMSDGGGKRDQVGLYADGVVSKFTNNLTSRATNAAVNRKRGAGDTTTKGDLIQGIGSDLDDQSDKWIDPLSGEGANEAFADGRQAGYEQYSDEIGQVIYSALLDINTCEACATADGQEGATPDDIPDAPNPDCDGGDRCRCVHVYVFSDEGKAAA